MPSLFAIKEDSTIKLLSSYVDDLNANKPNKLWTQLREAGWVFGEAKVLSTFLGVAASYPTAGSRLLHLSQGDYLALVVKRYEERTGVVLKPRRTLPTDEPPTTDEQNEAGKGVRGDS